LGGAMEKLYLEGTKTMVLENNTELKLDYYLVEDQKDHEQDIMLYGIKIVQHMENNSESEYTEPISYSKDVVKEMVHKLWYFDVTLTSMLEIVDDLVSDCVL
jgi:hypothetical protein